MIQAILAGFTLGLLLMISVSPVFFAVIKQSINNGKSGGISFVIGVLLSDILWIVLSNVFSQWVIKLLDFKKEIAIFGSIFLSILGIYYIFFKKVHVQQDENKISVTTSTHIKIALSGFLINSLNPTLILFWLTTVTTLATAYSAHLRLVIFVVAILLNLGADILKVILAGKIRSKLNEKNILLVNRISGSILLAFGIALFIGAFYGMHKI
jgi:threonine/homoserine/homoserine lactone efflux protein